MTANNPFMAPEDSIAEGAYIRARAILQRSHRCRDESYQSSPASSTTTNSSSQLPGLCSVSDSFFTRDGMSQNKSQPHAVGLKPSPPRRTTEVSKSIRQSIDSDSHFGITGNDDDFYQYSSTVHNSATKDRLASYSRNLSNLEKEVIMEDKTAIELARIVLNSEDLPFAKYNNITNIQKLPNVHMDASSDKDMYINTDMDTDTTDSINTTAHDDTTTISPLQQLQSLGSTMHRRVCQRAFNKNDIVWVCRTCQADETCVLCHECFEGSNHDGHDVAFYHAQAGGCCDCGDGDAWNPAGFCSKHGEGKSSNLDNALGERARGVVAACGEWLHSVAKIAKEGRRRVHSFAEEKIKTFSDSDDGHGLHKQSTFAKKRDNQNNKGISRHVIHVTTGFDPEAASTSKSRQGRSYSPKQTDNKPVFDPKAAGDSRSRDSSRYNKGSFNSSENYTELNTCNSLKAASSGEIAQLSLPVSQAQALGEIGYRQKGLFIILHADELHDDISDIVSALSSLYSTCTSSDILSIHVQAFPPVSQVRRRSLPDHILERAARIIGKRGDAPIYGTEEMVHELGQTGGMCWRDGDSEACERFGKLILDKAFKMSRCSPDDDEREEGSKKHGFVVSIKTFEELMIEVMAESVISFLIALSGSCDPLCQIVAVALGGEEKNDTGVEHANCPSVSSENICVPASNFITSSSYLQPMLEADLKLPRSLSKLWHALLLTLLAVPSFKASLANAYCDAYGSVSEEFAQGVGTSESSSYALAVQFLNRSKYVKDLAGKKDLLGRLTRSLLNTLLVARNRNSSPGKKDILLSNTIVRLNPLHPVLFHRRYGPNISDLKCVLNVQGMARLFASLPSDYSNELDNLPCLDAWVHSLSICQNMDAQKWRSPREGHVRMEPRGWVGAFNASISLGSLFERFMCWEDEDELPLLSQALKADRIVLDAVGLTLTVILRGVANWQNNEIKFNRRRCLLPFSSLAFERGCSHLAFAAVKFSLLDEWSFHLPLHRFAATCVKEVARRSEDDGTGHGIECLIGKFREEIEKGHNNGLEIERLLCGMIEFPLMVLSRAGQVRSDMFMRNGTCMLDQVLNYAEVPFCRALRDADLTLIQFSLICCGSLNLPSNIGTPHLIHLILHRFGIFYFAGFDEAPEKYANKYLGEIYDGLYPDSLINVISSECDNDLSKPITLPTFEEDLNKDVATNVSMLEEALHLIILLITELPPPPASTYCSSHKSESNINTKSRPNPYAPMPPRAHPLFARIRKDLTSDSCVLAMIYRILHVHCRQESSKDLSDLKGKFAYGTNAMSETLLARAIHILTLGIYAWDSDKSESLDHDSLHCKGGLGIGSIFHLHSGKASIIDLIDIFLLANPENIMGSDWYKGEDCALILIDRLASNDLEVERMKSSSRKRGGFLVSDDTIRTGAAWIRNIATSCNQRAASLLKEKPKPGLIETGKEKLRKEGDLQRRKREAKERALNDMNAKITLFEKFIKEDKDSDKIEEGRNDVKSLLEQNRANKSKGTEYSSKINISNTGDEHECKYEATTTTSSTDDNTETYKPPLHIFNSHPQCIICMDDNTPSPITGVTVSGEHSDSEILTDEKCLSFFGYIQASTVLNGVGDIRHNYNKRSKYKRRREMLKNGRNDFLRIGRFVETHVSLCGHAVHNTCYESYMNDPSRNRSEGGISSRCPLCKRLSNCIVPFVNVPHDWILKQNVDRSVSKEDIVSLHSFLDRSKWWVSHNDKSWMWDNKYTFLPSENAKISSSHDNAISYHDTVEKNVESIQDSCVSEKKDIFLSWHRVFQRTQRFVCGQSSRKKSDIPAHMSMEEDKINEKATAVDIWKRLMIQLYDISYKADMYRLGEDELLQDAGEFRHHLKEKSTFEKGNLTFDELLASDQDAARERLISKLFLSIKALVYSCCAESAEFRRNISLVSQNNLPELHSRFGISKSFFGNMGFIVLSNPASQNGLFYGKLGRLRRYGLAVLVATSAASREVVQLSLDLPLHGSSDIIKKVAKGKKIKSGDKDASSPEHVPVVFPILSGHVLTRTVAAICAVCGDHLTKNISYCAENNKTQKFEIDSLEKQIDPQLTLVDLDTSLLESCYQFVKLGLLAKTLQVIFGALQFEMMEDCTTIKMSKECFFFNSVSLIKDILTRKCLNNNTWEYGCLRLLEVAIDHSREDLREGELNYNEEVKLDKNTIVLLENMLTKAILMAKNAAAAFLNEVALIFQVILPRFIPCIEHHIETFHEGKISPDEFLCFGMNLFRMESINEILQSDHVCNIIRHWCKNIKLEDKVDDAGKRLQLFDCYLPFDWPIPEWIECYTELAGSLPTISKVFQMSPFRALKKSSVPLFGASVLTNILPHSSYPNIQELPGSYTDLYAKLGALSPTSDQTAVCLVCGKVLNAGGKGECTHHAYRCGGGCGIFFLLQECVCLIMHNRKAAYSDSPYVDSHGETPQYRGRPLNIDIGRYNNLHELWSSHSIRQQVVSERSSSRQLIISNFY